MHSGWQAAWRHKYARLVAITALIWAGAAAARDTALDVDDGSSGLGELFVRVQLEHVFPDSKTFVDAVPLQPPEAVLAAYRAQRLRPDFDLRTFVTRHFALPEHTAPAYQTAPGLDVRDHIDRLWDVLTREPEQRSAHSSRLPLPYRYVVPGGRFEEIYYWDSYFTMLGLEVSDRHDLTLDMLRNFAWLIDRYGFIPNGSRTYYLSRSQPPFFALMVELVAQRDGRQLWAKYLPQLQREYAFWMDGEAGLPRGRARRRVVRLPDGSLLNRYWDASSQPRPESYREDVETAHASGRVPGDVYRDLRAAAESGWDFSSRWLADGQSLSSIRTTELLPPDLNSLLYRLELSIAKGCEVTLDVLCVRRMSGRAKARRRAIDRYLWNRVLGVYTDYDWVRHKPGQQVTGATVVPLFVGQSGLEQAQAVAAVVQRRLLQRYGLATTELESGQQWDAPNGWAPLQWMAVSGLSRYGHPQLAAEIAGRWISANLRVYRETGKLVEKYDLRGAAGGAGGEYPLQDGFGWTNGVLRKLLALYPTTEPTRTPIDAR